MDPIEGRLMKYIMRRKEEDILTKHHQKELEKYPLNV
jgi:hypothetical protein